MNAYRNEVGAVSERRVTGVWRPNQVQMVNQNGEQKGLRPNQGTRPAGNANVPPPPPPKRGSGK